MPAKDPERRRSTMEAWRQRSHTPEYMRWLGARRKQRIDTGVVLRRDLKNIRVMLKAGSPVAEVVKLIDTRLAELDAAERELGNRFDHERNRPFWAAWDKSRRKMRYE